MTIKRKIMDVTETLNRIKKAYEVKTKGDLALKMGVSAATFNTWRTRKNIPAQYILECSRLTGCDYDWLIGNNQIASATTYISGDRNVHVGGSANISGHVLSNNIEDHNSIKTEQYKDFLALIDEYATPKIIQEFTERLLKIKAAHEN